MSFIGQTATYTSSVKWTAVTAWATGAVKAVGALVRQNATPTVNNERVFVAIVAGTTHATTEPTWTFSRGDKITDNTVTWQEVTGQPAFNGDLTNTPSWLTGAKNTNCSQGHVIKDAAGTHIFLCTTGGNAGTGAEPTWNTAAVGNTTVDASATWTYMGTSFGNWAAPHPRIRNSQVANWGNGGTVATPKHYVGHDHAETQATSISWPGNISSMAAPFDILCVSTAGSVPPVAADLATTATVSSTGASSITIANELRVCYGIGFIAGTSGNQGVIWSGDNADKHFESCSFGFGVGIGTQASFQMNNTSGLNSFKDCTFTFRDVAQTFVIGGNAEFVGGSMGLTGTVPTNLFKSAGANNSGMTLRGVDLSALSGTVLVSSSTQQGNQFQFLDCKMPATYTPAALTFGVSRTDQVFISRCNSAGDNTQFTFVDQTGQLDATKLVARVSGAKDGATAISWKVLTTLLINAGGSDMRPPVIGEWNGVTGSNVTATIHGIINAAAVPTNLEAYIDVDYLGTAGSTQSTRKSSRVADYIATPANTTADTSADWTAGTVAARANTTAYALGDVIKLASNPGRLFICTTAGTTAGSEPGGYASAVDGGSVTDNTATFRAGCRFKMAVTLTSPQPAIVGNLYATIKFAKSATTVYFDPSLELT